MSTANYGAFVVALGGKNERVIQLPHPRVTFLAQNHNGRAALLAKLALNPNQIVPDGRGFSMLTCAAAAHSRSAPRPSAKL